MHLENTFTVALPVDEAWDVLLDIERIAPCMPGAELQEVEGDEYRGLVKLRLGAVTTQFKGAVHVEEADRDSGRIVMRAQGRDTRGQGNANATIIASVRGEDGGTRVDIDTDLAITGKLAQFGRGVMGEVSKRLLDQFVASLEADIGGTGAEGPVAAATPDEVSPAPVTADEAVAAAGSGSRAAGPARGPAGDAGAGGGPVAGATGAGETASITSRAAVGQGAATSVPAGPAAGGDGGAAGGGAPGVRRIESRPAEPVDVLGLAGGSVAERAVPALTLGLLLAVALARSARRRLTLAAIGAALLAAATRWQWQHRE